MQHIILTVITMAIVRIAWVNFKKLGVLRKQFDESNEEADQRQQQTEQMRYITRILVCLVLLAIAPFAFTLITK